LDIEGVKKGGDYVKVEINQGEINE